ncbi:MAG: hypothetical protein K8R99_12870 [Actinomycetia bacterium]|nr:hypothetical protein [Actinomycetes bacterium]
MTGAGKLWATTNWRRHWPSLALAWVVLALTGVLALGAAMGARRAASAFDRLHERTSAAQITVFDLDVGAADEPGLTSTELISRMLQRVGAEGAAIEERFFVSPVGSQLIPTFDIYPIVQRQLLGHPINVPVALTGRLPHQTAALEIAVSQQFAKLLGVQVGESITFESASIAWVERAFSGADSGPTDGPQLEFVVTGIVVSPLDFVAPSGTVYLTTAFGDAYADQIAQFPRTDIRMADEAEASEMMRIGTPNTGDAALDSAIGIYRSQWGDQQQVTDGLRVAASALWIFAIVALVSGLATTSLIIKRLARALSTDAQVLSSLGVTRVGQAAHGALLLAPVIVFGVTASCVGALLLAPQARLGLARQVEPDRGIFLDWPLLLVGAVILATVTLLGAVPPLRRRSTPIVSAPQAGLHSGLHRRFRLSPAIKRPIPITLGLRDSLGPRGRATVVTAVCLMTLIVTSLAVGASVRRLPTQPALWGAGGDLVIDFGEREGGEQADGFLPALGELSNDARVGALTGATVFFPDVGETSTTAVALDARIGEPILTVLAGRAPLASDEVAMGRTTMRRLNLGLGDELAVSLNGVERFFRVVGQVVFPIGDFTYDDGLAITAEGSRRFDGFDDSNRIYQVYLSWADGVDEAQATAYLTDQEYHWLDRHRPPPVVVNLIPVKGLPGLLALFFGGLGLAALAYLLGVSSRAKERQMAVLGALGLRPNERASTLRWQAATVALIAVLVGVPAGLVLGRGVWAAIAHGAGVAVSHSTPMGAIVASAVIAALGALGIALALSGRTGRRRLAELLRAD